MGMNPEVKKLWIEALVSDTYEQIIDRLYDGRNGTIRCCVLGVLNDISGLGRWTVEGLYEVLDVEYLMEDLWEEYVIDMMGDIPELRQFAKGWLDHVEVRLPTQEEYEALPSAIQKIMTTMCIEEEEGLHPAVQKWANLKRTLPVIKVPEWDSGGEYSESISVFNDGGMSFKDLAKFIQEQL